MTIRESDGRIVTLKFGPQPDGMKPSNIGAGKAVRVSRDPDRTSPVLSDGITMINRPDHITTERRDAQFGIRCCRSAHPRVVNRRHDRRLLGGLKVISEAREPDALTAHVRIYEGGDLNCAWKQYCDTTTGNQVANRENKPYPKHKRIALLTRSTRSGVLKWIITLANPVIANVELNRFVSRDDFLV